jgi:coenzyme F420-reducing hydrogenase alpha subunit
VRVGGFYKLPSKEQFAKLRETLLKGREIAEEIVQWTAGFTFPDSERDYTFVALQHPDVYAVYDGRIVSNRGLDIDADQFNKHFKEEHVAHSNALQGYQMDGSSYLCGPLARYSLNYPQLSERARNAAKLAGLKETCRNPYQSIIVRAVETLHAFDEAIELIEAYEPPERPFMEVTPRAGEGYGATEAPRGILVHRYKLAEDGSILEAQIVPPTAQNQPAMEEDLMSFIDELLDEPDDVIRHRCEQTIRNYDPCISCATHFLKLTIDRG